MLGCPDHHYQAIGTPPNFKQYFFGPTDFTIGQREPFLSERVPKSIKCLDSQNHRKQFEYQFVLGQTELIYNIQRYKNGPKVPKNPNLNKRLKSTKHNLAKIIQI